MENFINYLQNYWYAFVFGIITIVFIIIIFALRIHSMRMEKHKYAKAEIEKSASFKKYNVVEVDTETFTEIDTHKE